MMRARAGNTDVPHSMRDEAGSGMVARIAVAQVRNHAGSAP